MIQIQQSLPLNYGFGTKELCRNKKNRAKDPVEFSIPTANEWSKIWTEHDPVSSLECFRMKPVTLKVSIDPEIYKELGYISVKLDLRLSEQSLIKEAVEIFVTENNSLDLKYSHVEIIGVGHSSGSRMKYVKIKLKASTSNLIGYPGSGGLVDKLGMSRQLIVRKSVNNFLEFLKK